MKAATLFLVRHGTTDWNEAGRLQGQSDIPLNDQGRRDAAMAAQRLAEAGILPAAVYSSDLARAVETARVIAARLGRPPVHLDARLRERFLGAAEGLTRAEAEARFGHGLLDQAAGAEPLDALVHRVDAAVDELAARHPGRPVVVVSHG
ncbi:MAG TPA: histidine phosphatase family protein, partial [Bacillota bacterium]